MFNNSARGGAHRGCLSSIARCAVWEKPMGRSARELTRDAKAVSGKPEGSSPFGYDYLSL